MDTSFELRFVPTFCIYSLFGGTRGWNRKAERAAKARENLRTKHAEQDGLGDDEPKVDLRRDKTGDAKPLTSLMGAHKSRDAARAKQIGELFNTPSAVALVKTRDYYVSNPQSGGAGGAVLSSTRHMGERPMK